MRMSRGCVCEDDFASFNRGYALAYLAASSLVEMVEEGSQHVITCSVYLGTWRYRSADALAYSMRTGLRPRARRTVKSTCFNVLDVVLIVSSSST